MKLPPSIYRRRLSDVRPTASVWRGLLLLAAIWIAATVLTALGLVK